MEELFTRSDVARAGKAIAEPLVLLNEVEASLHGADEQAGNLDVAKGNVALVEPILSLASVNLQLKIINRAFESVSAHAIAL
jgi:hypothetical protein